jgi:hypothetical protein
MSEEFIKVPCKQCPFRNDVRPYLHPDRAYEIASAAENRFNTFYCHKTLGDDGEDTTIEQESKMCAGFLTMMAQNGDDLPDGFEPSWDVCYVDKHDMLQAYETEWYKNRKRPEQS